MHLPFSLTFSTKQQGPTTEGDSKADMIFEVENRADIRVGAYGQLGSTHSLTVMECIAIVHTSTCMILAPDSQCFESPRIHARHLEGCKHLYSYVCTSQEHLACTYILQLRRDLGKPCEQSATSAVFSEHCQKCHIQNNIYYKLLRYVCIYSEGPSIGYHIRT